MYSLAWNILCGLAVWAAVFMAAVLVWCLLVTVSDALSVRRQERRGERPVLPGGWQVVPRAEGEGEREREPALLPMPAALEHRLWWAKVKTLRDEYQHNPLVRG